MIILILLKNRSSEARTSEFGQEVASPEAYLPPEEDLQFLHKEPCSERTIWEEYARPHLNPSTTTLHPFIYLFIYLFVCLFI